MIKRELKRSPIYECRCDERLANGEGDGFFFNHLRGGEVEYRKCVRVVRVCVCTRGMYYFFGFEVRSIQTNGERL